MQAVRHQADTGRFHHMPSGFGARVTLTDVLDSRISRSSGMSRRLTCAHAGRRLQAPSQRLEAEHAQRSVEPRHFAG